MPRPHVEFRCKKVGKILHVAPQSRDDSDNRMQHREGERERARRNVFFHGLFGEWRKTYSLIWVPKTFFGHKERAEVKTSGNLSLTSIEHCLSLVMDAIDGSAPSRLWCNFRTTKPHAGKSLCRFESQRICFSFSLRSVKRRFAENVAQSCLCNSAQAIAS